MQYKKPQSVKDVRPKVNSGLNRNNSKKSEQVAPQQRRAASAIQSSGEKSVQGEQLNDKLNNIVQDYLVRCNYLKTLEVFEQEMLYGSEQENHSEAIILQQFDRGERELFFQTWSRLIPVSMRQDHESWKLEFYVQIYFLIYAIHPINKQRRGQIDKQSVSIFKAFLESKGSDLSKTNEVLTYFSLPYVPSPQTHPAFMHFFTHEWVIDLRDRIREQVNQQFGQEQQGSQLKRLLLGQNMNQVDNIELQDYVHQLGHNVKQLQQENAELKKKLTQQSQAMQQLNENAQQNLMETQQKWFQFTRDLVTVSKDLLKVIESNQSNPSLVSNCKKKVLQYDKFLSQNIEDLMSQSQDISLFEKASMADQDLSHLTSHQQIHVPAQQSVEELMPLDYSKIIKLFTSSTNYLLVANVLQALRWRITRARSALERRSVVVAFATHDIIGTHQKNILLAQYLMLKAHVKISCQTLKLLNALASDYSGRTYLTTNQTLIKFLIEIVKRESGDSAKRKNAIGALQKLSLRKQSQNWMFDNDIIYHTLMILKNEKFNLSEYTYEYITALIMNLSLSTRGKDALCTHKELAFEVLFQLIEFPNDQIRTFTNGTFYSMFSRKELREFAYQLHIPQQLPALLENADERFKKQIQYMIAQLQSNEDDYESSQIEEDNDVDDIEDEEECVVDDEDDEDMEGTDMVLGESLLRKEFGLEGEEAEKQKVIMDSIVLKELQQRSNLQELRESQLEKMPVGQLAFYTELVPDARQQYQKSKQPKPSEAAFVARPKIPRTPPMQQPL